jgi:glutathione-regulated potassium-efflux system ancillary protein KefF
MPHTLVIHAHPSPRHSVAVRAMQQTMERAPDTTVRALYQLYPDFDIDVPAEQAALVQADLVVWLAPVYWYSVPALLKHWFDQVLAHGWAFGPGGDALRGKVAWWVASAGGSLADYAPSGVHQRPFADFVAPIEQTARFCGMRWLPPHIQYGQREAVGADPQAQLPGLAEQLAAHQAALASIEGRP